VEWTPPPSAPGGPDPDSDPTPMEPRGPVFTEPHWTLFFDRSAVSELAELEWSSSTQAEIK
jgi:hypothetical protein